VIDLTLACCSLGAARCAELSAVGQWQNRYLQLSGRKVRTHLLERAWMHNAAASSQARAFSRLRTAKPQKPDRDSMRP
jgi:hypothetical protein